MVKTVEHNNAKNTRQVFSIKESKYLVNMRDLNFSNSKFLETIQYFIP